MEQKNQEVATVFTLSDLHEDESYTIIVKIHDKEDLWFKLQFQFFALQCSTFQSLAEAENTVIIR